MIVRSSHLLALALPAAVRVATKALKVASNSAEATTGAATTLHAEYVIFKAEGFGEMNWYDFIPYAGSAIALKDAALACVAIVDK